MTRDKLLSMLNMSPAFRSVSLRILELWDEVHQQTGKEPDWTASSFDLTVVGIGRFFTAKMQTDSVLVMGIFMDKVDTFRSTPMDHRVHFKFGELKRGYDEGRNISHEEFMKHVKLFCAQHGYDEERFRLMRRG